MRAKQFGDFVHHVIAEDQSAGRKNSGLGGSGRVASGYAAVPIKGPKGTAEAFYKHQHDVILCTELKTNPAFQRVLQIRKPAVGCYIYRAWFVFSHLNTS